MADTIFYYSDSTTSTSSDTILLRSSWNTAKSLVGVNIGNGVIQIGDDSGNGTFADCNDLIELVIPDNVTTIGESIFFDSTNLKKIIVGKNVTSLGFEAFASTYNLNEVYFLGNAPTSIGLNIFISTPNLQKVYRKKNFVTGWESTLGGKPVVLWSDNVIKSGGTGKLIALPRTYYYLFDSYEFTVNGFSFFITGPIEEISSIDKSKMENNIIGTLAGPIYKSMFSNFVLYQSFVTLGIQKFYRWYILYFNFNDLEDPENGIVFYYSPSFMEMKNLEDITQWINNDLGISNKPYVFKIIGRFPTKIEVKNSLIPMRNGIYNIKLQDLVSLYISPPIYEKKNELGVVVSTISSYFNGNSVIFFIDSFDTNTSNYYYNETNPIDVNNIDKSNIHPYQVNPYLNFYTDDPLITNDPDIQVVEAG